MTCEKSSILNFNNETIHGANVYFYANFRSMEITGKVVNILPLVKGQGRNGEWRKQEFILETPGQYPKQVCLSLWGDKIDESGLTQGEEIKAMIDIQSREHNGRWYTEVRAWKIEKAGSQTGERANDFVDASPEEDDLPF